jgi:sarcosine oxidase, subunit gamma
MAESAPGKESLQCAGLAVRVEEGPPVAVLRYFARDGAFASAVQQASALALPEILKAVAGGGFILGWRSPTESVCLADSAARLEQLAARLAHAADGCFVELTGGLALVRLTGERVRDLLCRLGGSASVPARGEARRSRLAEVAVLALCVGEGETLLLIERCYLAHVLDWVRETVLDFADERSAARL